jgi:uncharacterized membrane protein
MKKNKKYFKIMFIGLLISNFDFILKHYMVLTDTWIYIIKGVGLGLMLLSLYLMKRHKGNASESCRRI